MEEQSKNKRKSLMKRKKKKKHQRKAKRKEIKKVIKQSLLKCFRWTQRNNDANFTEDFYWRIDEDHASFQIERKFDKNVAADIFFNYKCTDI